jgi:PAS domain S-box-containing protein
VSARSPIVAYGLAVVAVALAWVARWLLDPVLGDELPFFTFYFAVLFASWRWGLGPGLTSLALGIVIGDYFFEAPRQTLGASALVDRFDTLRFAAVGVCVSAICEALHRQRRAAEMRREFLRVTLASIGDAVITTDALGRVAFLNPVAEQLTGWTQAEAEEQALERVFRIVDEETRRAVESPATRALREGLVIGLANHTILMRRDGTECAIDDSAAPIRDDLGGVSGCVLIFRDISERRRTELRIDALMTELKDADRCKDEFLAVLAHELRSPLSPIANAARLLGVREPADPVVARARDVIERQVAHLAHLVDDLLDVSRITRGKIALRLERVDVGPLVAGAVEVCREASDAAGVALVVCPPDEPLVVNGDPTRLSQVVQNLVANAVKFTPRGGRVEVAMRREEREIVLRVRDTGIGIAADMLEAIFEPFVQSERSMERTPAALASA